MPEVTDEELLIRVRDNNDYEAYTMLFHRHYCYLCEQSFALLRCEQKSEEIVSDLFYKIWVNRSKLNVVSKVKYYLRRSARNRCIDHLRKTRHETHFSDLSIADRRSDYPDPESYTIGRECQERVQAAIERLPPKSKKVFLMSREEGKKYREIAEELDLSIKTIETHMRRALIFLRGEIKGA